MGNYDDIIKLEHPTSKKHPRMPRENRAAQFSPFAALTGYEDVIDQAARENAAQEDFEKIAAELMDMQQAVEPDE